MLFTTKWTHCSFCKQFDKTELCIFCGIASLRSNFELRATVEGQMELYGLQAVLWYLLCHTILGSGSNVAIYHLNYSFLINSCTVPAAAGSEGTLSPFFLFIKMILIDWTKKEDFLRDIRVDWFECFSCNTECLCVCVCVFETLSTLEVLSFVF